MALLADLAQAVADAIDGGTFAGVTVSASRVFRVQDGLPESRGLMVLVSPESIEYERETRIAWSREVTITIGFVRKLTDVGPQFDESLGVVEAVLEYLRDARVVASGVECTPIFVANEPIVADYAFDQRREFASVVTVVYRA